MNGVADAWARLGIAATDDRREVKRAYGRLLKEIDPDSDPRAFIELREAYEAALQWGTGIPFWEEESCWELETGEAPFAPGETGAEPAPEEPGAQEDAEIADEEPAWQRWRPDPPPAGGGGGVRDALLELDRLLFDEPPPPAERVVAAGRAVMDHPDLSNVDRLTETEQWLAEAIAASIPRSDPLLQAAIKRFGWHQAARDFRRPYDIASVLGRVEDLDFLSKCRRPGHEFHDAVEALTGPPPERLPLGKLSLSREVGRFLAAIEADWPSLERDLDPDSAAWWRAYLEGRHLPADFLALMVVLSLALTLGTGVAIAAQGVSLFLLPLVVPLAVLATWGALLGMAELAARARRRRAAMWLEESPPGAGIEPILAAALLLPPLIALLPDGKLSAGVALAASVGLAIAGWTQSRATPYWEDSLRIPAFLPVIAAVVGIAALGRATFGEGLRVAPSIAAMCWLGAIAFGAAQARLLAAPRSATTGLLAASLALVCGIAVALFVSTLQGFPPLWVLLIAPSAIVAGHLASAASTVDVHFLEWPLRVVALIVYFFVGAVEDLAWLRILAAACAYGLLYVGARLAWALLAEIRHGREETA